MEFTSLRNFESMTPEQIAQWDANVKARSEESAKFRAEQDQRELDRKRAETMVPRAFLELVTGGALDETEALAEVSRESFDVLVLAGAVGRGKTVAACWWLLEAIGKSRHSPLFVSSARLSRWERYDNAEMNRLLLATRLVIDDLGEEFNDTKGNFLAVLDETVSDRISNRRKTIITTNLDVAKFRERYGERVTDRIKGAGRWVAFTGASMRAAK